MTIALYMDEHVHKGITDGLREREVDVLTVQEDNRTSTPDPIILDRATELQRVMFTQDQDFLIEANRVSSTLIGRMSQLVIACAI
jgi:predicted nuclease of predicted toxin-antitoxin system